MKLMQEESPQIFLFIFGLMKSLTSEPVFSRLWIMFQKIQQRAVLIALWLQCSLSINQIRRACSNGVSHKGLKWDALACLKLASLNRPERLPTCGLEVTVKWWLKGIFRSSLAILARQYFRSGYVFFTSLLLETLGSPFGHAPRG